MKAKSSFQPMRIGLIGCGAISNAYFKGLAPFSRLSQITACADIDLERARQKAAEHGVAKTCSVDDLLADPEIDAVLNLTIPAAHAGINLRALKSGKHAYCEKPFSLTTREGLAVLKEARKRKLRVGCAPDTVLGGAVQTCRELIANGAIGRPIAAMANMLCHGHESWHPNPDFYYQAGGGPLFDMGPYYLTALVTMLGPVTSVSAMARVTSQQRLITSQPRHGEKIKVEVPTHLSGVVEFEQGTLATVTMSFDIWQSHAPMLEIYGTEGALQCPDPNFFGGEVSIWTTGAKAWKNVPLTHSDEVGRGIGLADMADAINKKQKHRMSGELGLHVVETMKAFHKSSASGRRIHIKTPCSQPAALAPGLRPGQFE